MATTPGKPAIPITRADGADRVIVPDADPCWHPIAADLFRSLAESGQSKSYEPSDWQWARLAAELTSRALCTSRLSGQLFAVTESMWGGLLVTEADRCHARVEVERARDDGENRDAKLARLEHFHRMARGSVNDAM